ncbi:hypothetical protein TNCV_1728811 [Trichonephila clavipes]|nr:hypothetical protein TNCV_1728811 [Trichonephila clavipes]
MWKAGKSLMVKVDQVRIYRQRKCDEMVIRTGSSDSNSSRQESSSFDRVQRRSNKWQRQALEGMSSDKKNCTLLKRLLLAGVRRRRLLLILLVLYVVTTYFLKHSLWNALEHVRYKATPLKEDLGPYRELIFLQVVEKFKLALLSKMATDLTAVK